MEELKLVDYLIGIVGFLIVYVLNGIKSEITEVKSTVKNLETNLQEGINGLEHRVTALERDMEHVEKRCTTAAQSKFC